jgi:galactokinase
MLQLNPALADLASDAAAGLRERFVAEPAVTAAAPGRVNLIGEHVDYCDGLVLPFAIDRHIVIAGKVNGTDCARIASATSGGLVGFDVSRPLTPALPGWENYLRGVIRGFQDRGHHLPGFDAFIVSSLPPGAGLSSSAALTCAMATFLEGLLDTVLDTREKALLCQRAENDFAGVPCGIMDPFASAFGKTNRLILIDCRSADPELVPFENPDLSLLIASTHVRHDLADGAYAQRRRETSHALQLLEKSSWRDVSEADLAAAWDRLGDPLNRRARHVVTETARTRAAAHALVANDCEALAPLMAASHDSLRDDFEVSSPELDLLVDLARAIGRRGGVIGTRMTGGGFGGSTVTLCETLQAQQIAATLAQGYLAATGAAPVIFACRPAAGARLL